MARARSRKSGAVADEAFATEEQLRVAEEAGRLGIWEWDLGTNRSVWSRGMERLYGLRPGEYDGRVESFLRRVHPGDRSRLHEFVVAVRKRGDDPPHTEFRIIRPNGAVRWVWSRAYVFGYRAGARRIMGVNIDITEQVEARQQLEQASARLRGALRAEGLVVLHQDRALRYTWAANPRLGLDERSVVGRRDADLVDPASARLLTKIKRRVLRTGARERHQFRLARDGHEAWFDQVLEPTRDADGCVDGVLSAATDITARVHAQQALEVSRARLRDLVDNQRDVLEAERAAIARDVHDEIGAILTGVRLKLAALAAREASDESRAALRAIAAGVDRAHAATRDVCARLRPAELDDLGLSGSCRAHAVEWSRTTGIRVLGRFAALRREPPPSVAMDAFRAMQELLTNVARHARASRVRVSLAARDGMLAMRVADDGRGLPRAGRARGFGLEGLRERVARHGGRFELRSSAKGVDARIAIPLARPATPARRSP